MDDSLRAQVEEWVAYGRQDLDAARLIIQHGGPLGPAAAHIQQGVEKHLKGLLAAHGAAPRKIHDLRALLKDVVRYSPEMARYRPLCIRASDYYMADRYPPGPPTEYDPTALEAELREAEALALRISEILEGM